MFIESSAKAGFNIKALFRKLANALPGMESEHAAQPSAQCKDQPTPALILLFYLMQHECFRRCSWSHSII